MILRAAPITDGMKWKVEATAAGYRIIPKTMVNATPVLVLALQNPGLQAIDTNGLLLLQRQYVADSNYKDEWEIYFLATDYINA